MDRRAVGGPASQGDCARRQGRGQVRIERTQDATEFHDPALGVHRRNHGKPHEQGQELRCQSTRQAMCVHPVAIWSNASATETASNETLRQRSALRICRS